jgi:hypothetical protein
MDATKAGHRRDKSRYLSRPLWVNALMHLTTLTALATMEAGM